MKSDMMMVFLNKNAGKKQTIVVIVFSTELAYYFNVLSITYKQHSIIAMNIIDYMQTLDKTEDE
uniref:Uncharacterized protein n=1 Tax=Heterorhabditis bacteriophora TaxID=37862 RepID=A0A1I7W6G1_HETBA